MYPCESGSKIQIAPVVIGQGSEEVGAQRRARLDKLLAVVFERGERACGYLGAEAVADHADILPVLSEFKRADRGAPLGGGGFTQHELIEADLVARLCPGSVLLLNERNGQYDLALGIVGEADGELKLPLRERLNGEVGDIPALDRVAVNGDAPTDRNVGGRYKELFILYDYLAAPAIAVRSFQIRVNILDLVV